MRISDSNNIRNSIEPETIAEINDIDKRIFDRSSWGSIIENELCEMWVYVYLWNTTDNDALAGKIVVTYSKHWSSSTQQMNNIKYAYEKYSEYKTELWKTVFFDEVVVYIEHYFNYNGMVITGVYDVKMNIGI